MAMALYGQNTCKVLIKYKLQNILLYVFELRNTTYFQDIIHIENIRYCIYLTLLTTLLSLDVVTVK